ncbi:hypothetical protein C2845_PM05G06640 [Panicum miliaceum]|uniref:Uncharacterized protein n=1 Tax=Panicum miliaceum TaxID=4540 RepID=A0A3L6SX99_PANMI|nr:hypothetical protein C2845_PM05G06640 [Panicum miliaceum]
MYGPVSPKRRRARAREISAPNPPPPAISPRVRRDVDGVRTSEEERICGGGGGPSPCPRSRCLLGGAPSPFPRSWWRLSSGSGTAGFLARS